MIDGGATTAGSQAATALRDKVLPRTSVAGLSRSRSTRLIRQSGIKVTHFKGPGGPSVGVDGSSCGRLARRVWSLLDNLRGRLVLERRRGHAVVILIMVKGRRMGRHGRPGISRHASLEGFTIIIGRRGIVVHHGHTTTATIHGRPAPLRVFPRARHGTFPTVLRRRRTIVCQRIVWRLLSIHRRTKRRRVGIGRSRQRRAMIVAAHMGRVIVAAASPTAAATSSRHHPMETQRSATIGVVGVGATRTGGRTTAGDMNIWRRQRVTRTVRGRSGGR